MHAFIHNISILKRILFVSLFFACSVLAFSQSKDLQDYIDQKLVKIDENIADKQYSQAMAKIEEIETYSSYLKNDEHRLFLDLKKAETLYGMEQQQKAMDILLKGFAEAKILDLPDLRIAYGNDLSQKLFDAQNFSRSIYFSKATLNEAISLNDTVSILSAYQSIGKSYFRERKIDSSFYYLNKIVGYPLNEKTVDEILIAYYNLSTISIMSNDLESAEQSILKSLEINEMKRDTLYSGSAYFNLGNIYYFKDDYQKALEQYLRAYDNLKLLKSKKALEQRQATLDNISTIYEKLQNYKEAYNYLDIATGLKDSLRSAGVDQNISEIEAKYNYAKEAQRAEEEKNKRLKTQISFWSMAVAFTIFLIVGYIFYRNYRLNQQSKLEKIENEAQTRIINATIDAKEKERKHIAQILHDSVSALLSSANLHLQASKAQLKKEIPNEINKAQVIVNEASVKIRDLSHELVSSVLLKFGLAFAVHDLCEKYSNSQITLQSDSDGIKRYDQDFEIKVYNIIEELINNILKHSKASNATIMLAHRDNNMLSVRISDDGVGFDPEEAKRKDGLGLSHIGVRIKMMKGMFNIISSRDNGTSIFIMVPIQLKGTT